MNTKKKIISLNSLKKKISKLRKKNKVAFTNGCFDILHYGHVCYLEEAKRDNRILIVGLNSDSSIKKIKGSKRPIISQLKRARVLAALGCINYVTIFNEETPYKLIDSLRPDILIKGADWRGKKVVGSDIVLASGGKVEYIKYITKNSTTEVIKKIIKKCRK